MANYAVATIIVLSISLIGLLLIRPSITAAQGGKIVAFMACFSAWGLIAPAGRHYREPHLFIFHVGTDLLIDSITAYWNDAGISQQLGHNEVD